MIHRTVLVKSGRKFPAAAPKKSMLIRRGYFLRTAAITRNVVGTLNPPAEPGIIYDLEK